VYAGLRVAKKRFVGGPAAYDELRGALEGELGGRIRAVVDDVHGADDMSSRPVGGNVVSCPDPTGLLRVPELDPTTDAPGAIRVAIAVGAHGLERGTSTVRIRHRSHGEPDEHAGGEHNDDREDLPSWSQRCTLRRRRGHLFHSQLSVRRPRSVSGHLLLPYDGQTVTLSCWI